MKIGEIRRIIDRAGYTRNDYSGHTREEFLRANVPERLVPLIEELKALVIAPRFKMDEERRLNEIERLYVVLDRWKARRVEAGLRPEVSQPPATVSPKASVTVQERNVIREDDIHTLPCQTLMIQ